MTNKSQYIFGIQSKPVEFLCKYPWISMLATLLLVGILISISEYKLIAKIKSTSIVFFILIINTLIMSKLTKNYSYKTKIDKKDNSITFYLMFNRGIYTESIKKPKIIIDHNCKIVLKNRNYVVFAEMIHKIAQFFPIDTEVEYKGFFGKIKKREWSRKNRLISPGLHQ